MLRRPVAIALLVGTALTPVTLPAVTGSATACAAATGPHAALVIETGTRDLRLCVALDAPSVTGIHLIELAGEQQRLAYSFGSGGQAVCRLAGVGPQGGDCFADYPDFWGYWRGDGRGGWTWSSAGAASTTVGDGDLDGWVWGAGDTGTTHQRPPALVVADVCIEATPTPSPAPTPAARSSSPRTATGNTGRPTSSSEPTPSPKRSERPDTTLVSTSSASALVAAADQGPPAASPGPGLGLLLALSVGLALAGGGWLRLRSAGRRDQGGPR
jgi:hypothetical protein